MPPISPSTPRTVSTMPPASRDRAELETLLASHSSLSPAEERVLVDAFSRARAAGPSSHYDVYVTPDRRADAVISVSGLDPFKNLKPEVQDRLGSLVNELKGRFIISVQEKKPWKLTLGMRRPLVQHAYKTVESWNKLIKELSRTNPELAELKLKFGKKTDGLMRDELMQKLGTPI